MAKPFIFIILYLFSASFAINQRNSSYIRKCPNFRDLRQPPVNKHGIILPASLSSQAAYSFSPYSSISFASEFQFSLQNSSKSLKCLSSDNSIRNLSYNASNSGVTLLKPRNFHDVSSGSSKSHMNFYFTETGHFYDVISGKYYDNDEYCVKTISDTSIIVQICSEATVENTVILPKCCAIDETLLFWRRQCKRLTETVGRTPWQPPIYKSIDIPHTKANSDIKIIYQMAELPQNCTIIKYRNGSIEDQGYVWMSASKVTHYKDQSFSQEKDNIRLVLPKRSGGKVGLTVLHDASRKWRKFNYDNFCVEGFHNSKDDKVYTGKPDNFVVFFCDNSISEQGISAQNEDELEWKSRIYVVASLISLTFLLATIIVYLVLWENHMLKDMIITCYTLSTFGSYLFLTIAHMVYLYPNPEFTGLYTRGPFCYTVATLAHYFYLSSYLWLTVMNFDIWITFKSFQYVKRESRGWHTFTLYSCVGWIFPASLIAVFIVIDHVYRNRDPLTEIPVPDYAMGTCFVSPDFRGQYVYTPMAILLAVNVILIGMTIGIIIGARSQSIYFKTGGMSNVNNYNAKLFGKIFVLMGGTYTVEFLTWYYNNDVQKPWLIVGFEVVNNFTPVILFFILCVNKNITSQLRKKCKRFAGN